MLSAFGCFMPLYLYRTILTDWKRLPTISKTLTIHLHNSTFLGPHLCSLSLYHPQWNFTGICSLILLCRLHNTTTVYLITALELVPWKLGIICIFVYVEHSMSLITCDSEYMFSLHTEEMRVGRQKLTELDFDI